MEIHGECDPQFSKVKETFANVRSSIVRGEDITTTHRKT